MSVMYSLRITFPLVRTEVPYESGHERLRIPSNTRSMLFRLETLSKHIGDLIGC